MIFLHKTKLPKNTSDALEAAGYVPVLVDDFEDVKLVSGVPQGAIDISMRAALEAILKHGGTGANTRTALGENICRLYLSALNEGEKDER